MNRLGGTAGVVGEGWRAIGPTSLVSGLADNQWWIVPELHCRLDEDNLV
jgi:hypothetical protein